MSSISNLGDVQTRSIVYIPREKQIVPFSGERGKDVHTVDEFIEEVERGVRMRGLRSEDQLDFILSLLKGSALEEVKLCMRGRVRQTSNLFSCLREAFREKLRIPQLSHNFLCPSTVKWGRRERLFPCTLTAAEFDPPTVL